MKLFNILILIFVLLFSAFSFAADEANQTTTIHRETDDYAVYKVVFLATAAADSVSNLTSKAMYIGFSDPFKNPGIVYVQMDAVTGTDVHIYVGGIWGTDLTYASYDPLDTSLDIDSDADVARATFIGWRTTVSTLSASGILASPAASCDYIVLKCDGQTGNPSTTTSTVYVKVWKTATEKQVKAHVVSTT